MLSFHSLNRTDLPPAHKPAPPPPKKKNSDMKGHLTSDDIQVRSSFSSFSLFLILSACSDTNSETNPSPDFCLKFLSLCNFVKCCQFKSKFFWKVCTNHVRTSAITNSVTVPQLYCVVFYILYVCWTSCLAFMAVKCQLTDMRVFSHIVIHILQIKECFSPSSLDCHSSKIFFNNLVTVQLAESVGIYRKWSQ